MADFVADAAPLPEAAATSVPPVRVFEHICADIRAQISAGTLRPGDKLPTERDLAQTYGAGRNAVREALRSLEITGVVRLEKGRAGGAFIRPANSARVTLAMADLVGSGSIGLRELYEARMEIMDRVMVLATERAGEVDLARLEHLVDEIAQLKLAGDGERRFERTGEFFATLAECTGNRALVMIVTALNDTARKFVSGSGVVPSKPDPVVPGLRRVLRHMRANDPDAAVAELRARLMDLYRVIDRRVEGHQAGKADKHQKAAPPRRAGSRAARA